MLFILIILNLGANFLSDLIKSSSYLIYKVANGGLYSKASQLVLFTYAHISIILNFLKDFTYLFLEREEGEEKERERNINVWLSLTYPPGTWPTTQSCALTGNRTSNLLVYRPMLSPLSYTSQGLLFFIFKTIFLFYEG